MRFPRHLIGGQGAVVDVIERARTGPSVPAGRYFAPPKCHPLITVAHETHQFPAGHLARTQPAGLQHVDGDVATLVGGEKLRINDARLYAHGMRKKSGWACTPMRVEAATKITLPGTQ